MISSTQIASGQAAIATLAQFPGKIAATAATLNGYVMGPYTISVNCTYESGCKNASYSAGFGFKTSALSQSLVTAQQHAATFRTAFSQAGNWLTVTMPNNGATLHTNAAEILAIIKAATESGQLSPTQRKALAVLFANIRDAITQGLTELESGSVALAAYQQEQDALTKQVGGVIDSITTTNADGLAQLRKVSDGQPCGQQDAENQYQVLFSAFQGVANNYHLGFNQLKAYGQGADEAIAILIGLFTDYHAEVVAVIKDLDQADTGDLSLFMKRVKVAAATDLWDGLAAQAQQSFGKPTNTVSGFATTGPNTTAAEAARFGALVIGIRKQMTALSRGPWHIGADKGTINFPVAFSQTTSLLQRLYDVTAQATDPLVAASKNLAATTTCLEAIEQHLPGWQAYVDKLPDALSNDFSHLSTALDATLSDRPLAARQMIMQLLEGYHQQMATSISTIRHLYYTVIPEAMTTGKASLA